MKRFTSISIVFLFVLISSGCVTSTPVKEVPLKESKEDKLRRTLLGTWEKIYYKSSRNAPREPRPHTITKWTFREDGTGSITSGADNDILEAKRTNSFQWKLKGRNLAIGDSSNPEVKFRIDDWSNDQMTWFRYQSSSYYIVEKID